MVSFMIERTHVIHHSIIRSSLLFNREINIFHGKSRERWRAMIVRLNTRTCVERGLYEMLRGEKFGMKLSFQFKTLFDALSRFRI